ncbi:sigma-70 family RNA polymerase sigma factor [Micromonospora sp. RTGN7]|uniref:RNA polymerase sigma factor n=1 Tax=Micromonospora sp. RTGN7 TaxID=3016526 RepID=UPI0029FF0EC2|nr:sigma-70 family RNA polymerase sigma factor [Micromonospora sp. RTGN7]
MTDRTATALVAAAVVGDEAAWAELVRRYAPLVASVIRAHGMSRADASDVNQTVWLRLVERLDQVRDPEALAAWLSTTTRRECYRLSRLDRRSRPVDPYDDALDTCHGPLVEAPAPDEELLRAERRKALWEGFAQLPPRCQELLALLTADPPVSYREVGERLGMPMGSIGPTQARCLRRLRNCPVLVPFLGARRGVETNGGERDGAVAAGR